MAFGHAAGSSRGSGRARATVARDALWLTARGLFAQRLALSMGGAVAIGAIEAFLYWRYFTQEPSKEVKTSKAARVLRFDHPQPLIKSKAE